MSDTQQSSDAPVLVPLFPNLLPPPPPPPLQNNHEQVNSMCFFPIPPPPPIQLMNLQPPEISTASYLLHFQREQLRLLNNEQAFSSLKDEVQLKYKSKQQESDRNAKESTSTGQPIMVDITRYVHCKRCDHWLPEFEIGEHLNYHASIIFDNLLLGNRICSMSRTELVGRMKVTHIVNAAAELSNAFENQGIKYLKLNLFDDMSESVIEEAQRGAKFVHEAIQNKGVVFVHCAMGKSRSVVVIVIYLMQYRGMNLDSSLQYIRSKRPIAKPNPNYMRQLKEYEESREATKDMH